MWKCSSIELDARGPWHLDGAPSIGEHARLPVAAEDLHLVRIAAGAEQQFATRRDAEVARMDACGVESHLGQCAIFVVHLPDSDAIALEAMRSIDELTIGRNVYVGAGSCIERVGLKCLDDAEFLFFILQHKDLAGELAQKVGIPAVGRPGQMARPGAWINLHVVGLGCRYCR